MPKRRGMAGARTSRRGRIRRARAGHPRAWRYLGVAVLAAAMAAAPGAGGQAVGARLPPELRGLLQQEMAAVRDATHRILDALITGDSAVVAEQAQAIHDSFIMQQALSDADRRTLRSVLPQTFVDLDAQFHEVAAGLAAAARSGQPGRQHAAFARMTGLCMKCHRRFAGERFPGFQGE